MAALRTPEEGRPRWRISARSWTTVIWLHSGILLSVFSFSGRLSDLRQHSKMHRFVSCRCVVCAPRTYVFFSKSIFSTLTSSPTSS